MKPKIGIPVLWHASEPSAFMDLLLAIQFSGSLPFFKIFAPAGSSFGDLPCVFAGERVRGREHFRGIKHAQRIDEIPAGWSEVPFPERPEEPEPPREELPPLSHEETKRALRELIARIKR